MLQATGDRALFIAKEMTSTLRESERKYRFLIENINDVIWNIDLEGHLMYTSPAIKKLTGYSAEEILTMSINEFIVQEDYDALITKLAEELTKPQAERAESLLHVASTLSAKLELKTVLYKICEETCAALHMPLTALVCHPGLPNQWNHCPLKYTKICPKNWASAMLLMILQPYRAFPIVS